MFWWNLTNLLSPPGARTVPGEAHMAPNASKSSSSSLEVRPRAPVDSRLGVVGSSPHNPRKVSNPALSRVLTQCGHISSHLVPQMSNAFAALGDEDYQTTLASSNSNRINPAHLTPAPHPSLRPLSPASRPAPVCSVTGKSRHSVNLGIRVSLGRPPHPRVPSPRPGRLLSESAFFHLYGSGAWGDSISAWLPLALDPKHAGEALQDAKQAIRNISQACGLAAPPADAATVSPHEVVSVMSALLDGQVAQAMDAAEYGAWEALRESVGGYCHLQHLFLHLANAVPGTAEDASRRLSAFLAQGSAAARGSAEQPLGRVLALLAVSPDHPPEAVVARAVAEGARRSAGRVVAADSELLNGLLVGSASRAPALVATTGQRVAGAPSVRALVLHAAFVSLVARRGGASPSDMLGWLDKRFAEPAKEMVEGVERAARAAAGMRGWPDVFAASGVPCPSAAALRSMLNVVAQEQASRPQVSPAVKPRQQQQERRSSHGSSAASVRSGSPAPTSEAQASPPPPPPPPLVSADDDSAWPGLPGHQGPKRWAPESEPEAQLQPAAEGAHFPRLPQRVEDVSLSVPPVVEVLPQQLPESAPLLEAMAFPAPEEAPAPVLPAPKPNKVFPKPRAITIPAPRSPASPPLSDAAHPVIPAEALAAPAAAATAGRPRKHRAGKKHRRSSRAAAASLLESPAAAVEQNRPETPVSPPVAAAPLHQIASLQASPFASPPRPLFIPTPFSPPALTVAGVFGAPQQQSNWHAPAPSQHAEIMRKRLAAQQAAAVAAEYERRLKSAQLHAAAAAAAVVLAEQQHQQQQRQQEATVGDHLIAMLSGQAMTRQHGASLPMVPPSAVGGPTPGYFGNLHQPQAFRAG